MESIETIQKNRNSIDEIRKKAEKCNKLVDKLREYSEKQLDDPILEACLSKLSLEIWSISHNGKEIIEAIDKKMNEIEQQMEEMAEELHNKEQQALEQLEAGTLPEVSDDDLPF